MIHKKMRSLLTVVLVVLFTAGIAISALAATVAPTAEATGSTTVVSDQNTATTSPTSPSTTPTIKNGLKSKLLNIRQQFNQIRKQEHQVQVQQKKLQKLMPKAEFKKLLDEEVNSKVKGKKNMFNARQGVILKIETAANGKTVIFIRRGDASKIFNNYFTANLNPEKIVVYDRTLKAQKTLADIKVGDVVRVFPVRGASLTLVEKIGHRDIQTLPPVPVPTTPDTLTVTN